MRVHVGIPGKSLIITLDMEGFAALAVAVTSVLSLAPGRLDSISQTVMENLFREIAAIARARDFIPHADVVEDQERAEAFGDWIDEYQKGKDTTERPGPGS